MDEKVFLLVEDNPVDVFLTQRAFRKASVSNEIVVAQDGVGALEYLFGTEGPGGRDSNTKLVAVLLDLKLPKMDGFEVLRRIRADERTKLLPVVVLTSSMEAQDVTASYRLGANSYIRKPVSFDQLAEAARQLGLYWATLNEAPPAWRA